MLRAMSPATSAAWAAESRPKASRSGSSTAIADGDDLVGELARGLSVAAVESGEGGGNQQHPSGRDRHVRSQLFDDALRARHPRACLRHLAAQQQDERRPTCALRCPVTPTGTKVVDMGPLPSTDAVLVSPDQVRGHGQHLELVGVETVARVGEQGVRLVPGMPSERITRCLHDANRR